MNISDLLKDPNKAKEVLEKAINSKDKELAELLIPIVKDPFLTYRYANEIVKGKIKNEWEDIIAQDSKISLDYALKVLHDPFPKGEDAIAQDPYSAYQYARYVLYGPFPKGEDAISKDTYFSYGYAKEVLKDRFKKSERTIINGEKYLIKDYMKFLKQIGKLNEFLKDHPEVKDKI
jgi:hypothetical protein